MRVDDLLNDNISRSRELAVITQQCGQFLQESTGLPVYKALPASYKDVQRVKVRLQKRSDAVTEAFNKAFDSQFTNLRQRAVFAYSSPPELHENTEPFYVFPTNGYKYLYSKEITNSSSDYKTVIDTLFETFQDNSAAIEIVTDLLKYTYHTSELLEAIESESEIVFYNMPCYYAVRVDAFSSYEALLKVANG